MNFLHITQNRSPKNVNTNFPSRFNILNIFIKNLSQKLSLRLQSVDGRIEIVNFTCQKAVAYLMRVFLFYWHLYAFLATITIVFYSGEWDFGFGCQVLTLEIGL